MSKTMIIGLCILIILISGCIFQEDITIEICGILKQGNDNPNVTIEMKDNVCVVEQLNYTQIDTIICSTLLDKLRMVIKTRNDTITPIEGSKLPRGCEKISNDHQ